MYKILITTCCRSFSQDGVAVSVHTLVVDFESPETATCAVAVINSGGTGPVGDCHKTAIPLF